MGNNKLSDDAYRAALRRKVDSLANERAIVNGNGYGNEWIKNKRRFYFSKQMKKKGNSTTRRMEYEKEHKNR